MSLPATRLAKQPSGASDQDRYHSLPLRIEETRAIAAGARVEVNDRRRRTMRNPLGTRDATSDRSCAFASPADGGGLDEPRACVRIPRRRAPSGGLSVAATDRHLR